MITFTKTIRNYGLALLACLSFAFITPSQAQTLSAGDIAFTGINSDNPDAWSFLALTDLPAGTIINFTENGWMSSGSFRSGEGTATLSVTTQVNCGEEVLMNSSSATVDGNAIGVVITMGSFALSTSGDQILAYQGTVGSPTFIAAINIDGTGGGAWSDATSTTTSALPAGLTDGVNAVGVGETDNAMYNCNTTAGTVAELRTALNTASNWLTSGSPFTLPSGCEFVLSDCNAGPACPAVGALVITEIMQNPAAVSDANGEWFEVWNSTGSPIDMDGMVIRDNDFDSHTINGSLVVPANGFVVLGNNDDFATNGGVVVDYQYFGISIANGADELVIECAETVIDAVEYDGGPGFPDPNGASMNLDPGSFNAMANDDGANWCEASTIYGDGDFGTPGAANTSCATVECGISNAVVSIPAECQGENASFRITFDVVGGSGEYEVVNTADNSQLGSFLFGGATGTFFIDCVLPGPTMAGSIMVRVRDLDSGLECESEAISVSIPECLPIICTYPGGLVITEIMQNPSAVSDGNGEWFEVYNPTGSPINMNGYVIRDNDFDTHVITGSVVVPAYGYVVLGNNDDMGTNGGVNVDYEYSGNFFLSNGSDELVIECEGTIIDEVQWDNGATFPDPNGASMSLNPFFNNAFANDNGANWCEASSTFGAGDMGTPGTANDLCCGLGPILSPWFNHDIGAANGSAFYDPCEDEFTVNSKGVGDMVNDIQHQVGQFICGDGSITARVTSIQSPGFAGIFMRENPESDDPAAKKVELETQLSTFVYRTVRTTTGGLGFPQRLFRPQAAWLRIVRTGNQFVGYTSTNGINWTFAFFANVNMSQCIEVGIFTEGNNPVMTTTATFDNVQVTGGIQPPTLSDNRNAPSNIDLETDRFNQSDVAVNVFPNPAQDELFIKATGMEDKAATIKVINSLGQIVDLIQLDAMGLEPQRINLNNYQHGLYLISIEAEGQDAITRKVIVGKNK